MTLLCMALECKGSQLSADSLGIPRDKLSPPHMLLAKMQCADRCETTAKQSVPLSHKIQLLLIRCLTPKQVSLNSLTMKGPFTFERYILR